MNITYQTSTNPLNDLLRFDIRCEDTLSCYYSNRATGDFEITFRQSEFGRETSENDTRTTAEIDAAERINAQWQATPAAIASASVFA
jgi:hypothetical protein